MSIGYDGSIRIDTKINRKGFNTGINGMIGSLKKLAIAAGLAFGTVAIVNFGKEAIKASTELTNAMTGLKSIIDGQGRSFKDAQKFINEYVSDGLIPATQAITAYKNLAMRGYDTSQIEQVMTALKDSAAFGRQASLTMGEAIASATEGLKNENSILVDNAGVTKNVSMMWKDYAQSIGVGVNSLTKQQKIQAEVLGIMEETRFQTGDATKIANSYSGELLRLGFNFNNLKIAIGNALIPMAKAILPSINAIIAALTRLANVFAQVTTAIFGKQARQQEQVAKSSTNAAKAQEKFASATKEAGKEAKGATAEFDELNVVAKDTANNSIGATDDLDLGFGDIATGGEVGAGVTVSPDVQTAVDKLMKTLEPLKNISFNNLNNSFDKLKKSVEPITKAVFGGLQWAYLNIFIPFATWTMEDALPAFLTVLASAMNVLNSVIIALQPLAIWLWESFLKPLSEWAGDIIVQTLYNIAYSLNNLSEWINNNQELVQKIALIAGSIVLGIMAVVSAFEIFNAIAPVIVSAFTTIKAALAAINPVALLVVGIIALLVAAGIDLWKKSEAFKNSIVGIVNQIGQILKNVWESIIKPVFDTFMQTIDWLWDKHLKPLMANIWGLVQELIQVFAEILNGFILPLVNAFVEIFGPVIANVFQVVIGIVGTLLGTFADVIGGVITVIRGIIEFLTGVFTGDWKKAWNGIVKVFKGIFEGIGGVIKGVVNIAIDLINSMIRAITSGLNFVINAMNKINFKIPDWVPGIGGQTWGINIPTLTAPQIPKLATGAVIPPNSEFLAILGDQKSGTNIETPERLLRQIMKEELAGVMSGGDITIENNINLEGDPLFKFVKRIAWEEFKRSGESPFPAY